MIKVYTTNKGDEGVEIPSHLFYYVFVADTVSGSVNTTTVLVVHEKSIREEK